MSYVIHYRPGVERDMARVPRPVLRRVDVAIMALGANPRPARCRKLAGNTNLWRIRIGDWRVVYEINDSNRLIEIHIVAHRRDVYRGL